MATLEDIDIRMPVAIGASRHDLDRALVSGVAGLEPIRLDGGDALRFLAWVSETTWRRTFEQDLQCLSEDVRGRALLTAVMPLVTFREEFCGGGRGVQDVDTAALMVRLRAETRGWRDAGADLVTVEWHRAAAPAGSALDRAIARVASAEADADAILASVETASAEHDCLVAAAYHLEAAREELLRLRRPRGRARS